jgi:hypothetical protein
MAMIATATEVAGNKHRQIEYLRLLVMNAVYSAWTSWEIVRGTA